MHRALASSVWALAVFPNLQSEEEEERPGALRALPRSSGRRSGPRPAASSGSSRRRGRTAQRQGEGQALGPGGEDAEEPAAPLAEEEEELGGEEEVEEVMPTMEAEALPQARPQQGRRRASKLQSMFAAGEEEAAAEEQVGEQGLQAGEGRCGYAEEQVCPCPVCPLPGGLTAATSCPGLQSALQEEQQESGDDEDLPAIPGRTRGASQRQPAAIDPQPQLLATVEESEEEEERPARRRRRR